MLTSERQQNLPAESFSKESACVRVLVGDDQHDILTALSLLLKLNGFAAETADSPERLLAAANELRPSPKPESEIIHDK